MSIARHIFASALLFLVLSACGGREGRVIPEKKMAALYADMFIADQWLKENKEARAVADTTLFFDPIFERHGCTFADYEKSVEYYSADPEVFSGIVDSASAMLKRQADRYTKISTAIRKANETNEKNRADYDAVDFGQDSLLWAASAVLWPVKQGLPVREDTLAAGWMVRSEPVIEQPEVGRPPRSEGADMIERVEMKEIKLR